jgi:KipI family sensor histidine kinase inhibitor
MKRFKLNFSRYNEHSILIEWPSKIDEFILKDILNFKKHIELKYTEQKVEVINAYNTILVIYKNKIEDVNNEIAILKSLSDYNDGTIALNSTHWDIPVCYDEEFAFDLNNLSKQVKLSTKEIIKLHSGVTYTVFFIGFLPGFLYLGGLDSKLYLDRKSTPNLNISKGSVAIGGQQTGIYPQDSPGGWHIIGKTPIELFNPNQNSPCIINSGDKVKFVPISKKEFFDIKKQINNSTYQFKPNKTSA